MLTKRIKSFFIDTKKDAKEIFTKEEPVLDRDSNTLYAIQFKEEFVQQFPMSLNSYLAKDMSYRDRHVMIDRLYVGESYNFKVLFNKQEALDIIKKLNELPLEPVRDPRYDYLDANKLTVRNIDASKILPDPDFPGMFIIANEEKGEEENE